MLAERVLPLSGIHNFRDYGGYAVEGHVPAALVDRLLAGKPDTVGLAAPGMPLGSPGMGTDADAEPFDVLLIRKDGSTEVFATVQPDKG